MISHGGCLGEEAGVKMARSSVICSMTDGGQGKASEGQEIKAQLVVFFYGVSKGTFQFFFLFWSRLERCNKNFHIFITASFCVSSERHREETLQVFRSGNVCLQTDKEKNWDSSSVCAALKGAGCIYIGQIRAEFYQRLTDN